MPSHRVWFSTGVAAALLAGVLPLARAQGPITLPPLRDGEQPATVTVRKAEAPGSLDDQLSGQTSPGKRSNGLPPQEWTWSFQRFVNLGTPEPATLQETVHVAFVNRGKSCVRVTYRAKSPSGFPAGSFRGLKEVRYSMERLYTRVVIRSRRYVAEAGGPFQLVESDPPGHTLADFSTLGGIARGRNMVAVAEEAFAGENTFAINGDMLGFVNAHFHDGGGAKAFPAEIVLGPVAEERPSIKTFPLAN